MRLRDAIKPHINTEAFDYFYSTYQDLFDNLEVVFLMRHGSHLYHLNHEFSDTDLKGIYLPTRKELYLDEFSFPIPEMAFDQQLGEKNPRKRKKPMFGPRRPINIKFEPVENGKPVKEKEVDLELFSPINYLTLLMENNMPIVDMHFVGKENILVNEKGFFNYLKEHENEILNKNIRNFVEYSKRQSRIYSEKGDRLQHLYDSREKLVKIFKSQKNRSIKLQHLCDPKEVFTEGSYTKHLEPTDITAVNTVEICGVQYLYTQKVSMILESLEANIKKYGKRAKKARESKGKDWKALSHSVRISTQAIDLLTKKTIVFPLENRDYILDIKHGKVEIEEVWGKINENLKLMTELLKESDLIDAPDVNRWKNWLYEWMNCTIGEEL